ncbi:MAG: ABC transporter substrate-binding protein [Desulfosoma sp.]|uniref:ABC transporter substrate-binding protein n=1 Tax=Desulfosoma sp. TaxID=2603217 RepID=UPI0040490BFC
MKKAIFALHLLSAFIFLAVPGMKAIGASQESLQEGPRRIAVVVSRPLRPYMEALKGLLTSLGQRRMHALQPITLSPETQGDFRAVQSELLRLSADAFVSIGPEALPLVQSASIQRNIPWVYTMVLDPAKLVPHSEATVCGISLFLPAAEQLEAIAQTLPNRKRLGVFHSLTANQAFFQEAMRHAQSLGLTVQPIAVQSPKDIPGRLTGILPQVDALWIVPDPAIDSKALVEYLVETALYHNVPSIGYNRYFLEAGAAMAFVLDYEKIGAATAALLDFYLHSGRCPETAPPYDVIVNEHVLRRLLDHSSEEGR